MAYHINPETGDVGVCRAKKNCPYGDLVKDHYASQTDARLAYEKQQSVKTAQVRPPIILEPAPGLSPELWSTDFYSLLEATDSEAIDYYDSDYSEITSVDVRKAVETIVGMNRSTWPESLEKVVREKESEWGDASKWELENGYYDTDIPSIYLPAGMEDQLKAWYYTQPNAEDPSGILRHVREKGHDTSGLTPADAVKKMLREENGKILKYVELSSTVNAHTVKFNYVAYSKRHYDTLTPSEPTPANPDSSEIIGVVKIKDGKYRLLDGHHRMKWAVAEGRTDGQFLVL